MTFICKIQRK